MILAAAGGKKSASYDLRSMVHLITKNSLLVQQYGGDEK